MKALSVRAPWWWAILHGKPVENRDWYTNQRGRVYLHASKWWNTEEVFDDFEDACLMASRDRFSFPEPNHDWDAMKAAGGFLVGTVEIVDCVRRHPSAFFIGEFGFVLRNPVALPKPIPFKGALGFFDVDDEITRNLGL